MAVLEYMFESATSSHNTSGKNENTLQNIIEQREAGTLRSVPPILKNPKLPVNVVTHSDLFYAHMSITNHGIAQDWWLVFSKDDDVQLLRVNIDRVRTKE